MARKRYALDMIVSGVLGISVVALVAVRGAAQANREDVYAAPEGKGYSCSARHPCSVQQAKTRAARLAAHSHCDVHLVLADGTYQLDAVLRFGPEDSGRNGNLVLWEPAPGAHPVLSGGIPIRGWHPDAENPSLWSASVPAGLDTRQLYANGQRIPRSFGTSPVPLTQTADGFVAADDTLASWRNPSSIEFVFDGGHGPWTQPRCDVASVSGETIAMRQPCWSNMFLPSTPIAPDGKDPEGGIPSLTASATPTTIENAYELLSPGTWYLDRTRHVIYYDPRSGENPTAMSFVAPVLQQLVTTSSTAESPLHDVTFSGITFAYATWLEPSSNNGFPEMQATMYIQGPNGSMTQGLCQYVPTGGTCPYAAWSRPPAAVDLVGTERVSFIGNVFRHLGAAGLGMYHGAKNDLILGNEITDVSGNGIEFGTTDDPLPISPGEISVRNIIADNYVHNAGVEYTGAVGIWVGYARETTISHNEIGDLPYTGISLGWGGWHTNNTSIPFNNPSILADNIISDNMIYNVMGVRGDGGPIYTNGPQGYSLAHGLTLKGNVTFGNFETNYAYYNDGGGAFITINDNVQYADGGRFNDAYATHIIVKNNYYIGVLNGCDQVGTDSVDGCGNIHIPSDQAPGSIPSSFFRRAGLRPAFRGLSTRMAPAVLAVSPIVDHQVLISGSGFTPTSTVQINGIAASSVDYIGPNQITATLLPGISDGYVTVTTTAGTSAIDDNSYTYDSADDIAQGKVTQSSSENASSASLAVDGNTNGNFYNGSVFSTGEDQYAWWQVDLGSSQALRSISLWNRTDCCYEINGRFLDEGIRDTDYWIFVSNTPFNHSLTPVEQAAQPGVWSNHQTAEMGRPTRVPASTTGRYVMVQLSGTNSLAIAEAVVIPAH